MGLDVLIVDDEPSVLRSIGRLLPSDVTARSVSTKLQACRLLRDRQWACGLALIDVKLGAERRAGLDVLDVALRERPGLACALITGGKDSEVVRAAFVRGVHVLPKPFGREELAKLLADARPPPPEDPLEACIEARSAEWKLSPTQRDVLRSLARNARRSHLDTAAALGMKTNTLRAHVRELVRRSNIESAGEIVVSLLRDALSRAADRKP